MPSFAAAVVADEAEAFSSDSDWMPRVVLMAKSTYVWLDQLSRRYGRDLRTLDAIPDEELDTLASWGVTSLWLIGLWQRSVASERIKRMRGNPDAVASAYSLDDYRIADDLGGEAAYANLRDRAWARGIRLASDMVPNHMGIDSGWVIEHPEWFLSLPEPPFPAYTYTGADLSSDPRVGIVLEDHYWDDTDAAVVFKRIDRETGDERYVYHGNDGTSFPWNDTAQLDFLSAEVREHVIQVILDVARRFPVIRFDAAMVLARKHIQRLWWPLPGLRRRDPVAGGARDLAGGVRPADAERVLARGRRPGRRRSAGHAPAGRGLLDARGLLRADARHAPRLQQRVHAHAPRRERRRLPQAHPRDPRVRSRDPQALRQLHEQPGRGDGARAVRHGRQVLRGRDGHGDAARAADARPWPDRGLRREVRHGVPARTARRAAGSVARRAAPARDLPAAAPARMVRRGARIPAVRPRHGRRRRGRERAGVLQRQRTDAVAGRLSHALRVDRGHDPRIGGLRAQVRKRGEAPRPPIAGRGPRSHERSLDVRDVPRREDRAAVHPLIAGAVGARPVAVARRVPGPRVLGVRRGPRRDRGPVAAPRRAAGRRRRSVARRRAGRAAAGARSRAAPGLVRGRPRGGDHRGIRRQRRHRRAGGAGGGAAGSHGRVDRGGR